MCIRDRSDLKQNKTTTSGEINISTGETFAVQFLSPIISKFRKEYPDIKISQWFLDRMDTKWKNNKIRYD